MVDTCMYAIGKYRVLLKLAEMLAHKAAVERSWVLYQPARNPPQNVSLLLTHLISVAVSWNFAIKFTRSGTFQIYLHVLLYILGFELGQVNQLFKHYSHAKLDWLHHPLTDSECKWLYNNLLKLQGNNHTKICVLCHISRGKRKTQSWYWLMFKLKVYCNWHMHTNSTLELPLQKSSLVP